MIELRPYQLAAIDRIREASARHRAVLCVSPTGCHEPGQLVMLADGSTVRADAVRVGDELMGPDSRPREVLALFGGVGPMYRVKPTKGRAWEVNDDHVLSLVRTNDGSLRAGETVDVSVREWLSWNRTEKHVHKLFRVGVTFPDGPQLPIEPYFLGLLLGDGSLMGCVGVCKPDHEIRAEVLRQGDLWGLYPRVSGAGTSATLYLTRRREARTNPLVDELRALGLHGTDSSTKFVPPSYMRASREARLALLAGLLDTDGHLSGGGYDFVSKSHRLADGLVFVARSLGLAAYVSPCVKRCQTGVAGQYYRVSVSGDIGLIPCRLQRRQAAPREQVKSVLRTGFTVEPIGHGEFRGWQLDGDGRYLLGDFTVTHNSGKTTIGGEMMRRVAARGLRGLWLAHRTELVGQAYDRLREFDLDVGCISASSDRPPAPYAPIQVASIQTLLARKLRPAADLVVWDECHHAPADEWNALATDYRAARVVGFTATPERSDGRGLAPTFGALVVAATVRELVELGHLVPSDIRRPAARLPPKRVAQRPVDAWLEHAQGRPTIVFSQWVTVAEIHAAEFREVGVTCEVIHAGSRDRVAILERYQRGETTVVVNVYVLTEGFDAPATSCVILARGCGTVGTYLQMVGRGLRPAPGKTDCVILDLMGVSHDLGSPDDDRTYSLDGQGISGATEVVPGASCRVCGAPLDGGVCPDCGTAGVVQEAPRATGEALVPYAAKRAEGEDARVRTLARWIATAREKGHKLGAVRHKFHAVYGTWPTAGMMARAQEVTT